MNGTGKIEDPTRQKIVHCSWNKNLAPRLTLIQTLLFPLVCLLQIIIPLKCMCYLIHLEKCNLNVPIYLQENMTHESGL